MTHRITSDEGATHSHIQVHLIEIYQLYTTYTYYTYILIVSVKINISQLIVKLI